MRWLVLIFGILACVCWIIATFAFTGFFVFLTGGLLAESPIVVGNNYFGPVFLSIVFIPAIIILIITVKLASKRKNN